ncbi:hypothetical protein BT96DRAFT_843693, partial [Gymnopus androsaceus JB14]
LQQNVPFPFVTADVSGPKHVNTKLLHSQFKVLVDPLVKRTIDSCKSLSAVPVSKPAR